MEARDFVRELISSGMTQVEIAKRTGIPQPTISKVVRGDVADVLSRTYRTLERLHREVVKPESQANGAQLPVAPGDAGEVLSA